MTTISGAGGFSAVRVVGGLLPPDVLAAVVDGSAAGLGSNDFHLGGERPREAAARTWTYLTGVYRRFQDDSPDCATTILP